MRRDWQGHENLPDSGMILAANHISDLDPLYVGHMVYSSGRIPHFLAKKELFDAPVIGKALTRLKQIPVDRAGRSIDSLKMAEEVLAQQGVIIIYPEGTVTKDPDMWPMVGRIGMIRLALSTGAPVIPVGQSGQCRLNEDAQQRGAAGDQSDLGVSEAPVEEKYGQIAPQGAPAHPVQGPQDRKVEIQLSDKGEVFVQMMVHMDHLLSGS